MSTFSTISISVLLVLLSAAVSQIVILCMPQDYLQGYYKEEEDNFKTKTCYILKYWADKDRKTYPNLTIIGKIGYTITITIYRVYIFIGNFIFQVLCYVLPKIFKFLFIKNKKE